MPTWTIRIDRRKADFPTIVAELEELAASIQGLNIDITTSHDYWNAPDKGAFRDFVSIATMHHPDLAGLEYTAEELLETFGWLIDFRR